MVLIERDIDQWGTIESPEIILMQMVKWLPLRVIGWWMGKGQLSTNGARKTGSPKQNASLNPYTIHKKISPKYIKNFNVRAKFIKFLEKKMREKLSLDLSMTSCTLH